MQTTHRRVRLIAAPIGSRLSVHKEMCEALCLFRGTPRLVFAVCTLSFPRLVI